MRYSRLALLTGAVVLVACGGEKPAEQPAAGTMSATPEPIAVVPAVPGTGDTVRVNMVFTAPTDYRFEPADVTLKSGDVLLFVTVSGHPHNVGFAATNPADFKAQINANMPNKLGDLLSPVIMAPGDTYAVSFGGVKPGKYDFDCPLHIANGMKGTVTVQ
jgi:plastocyanin